MIILLGKRLAKLRSIQGLSQYELAKKLGFSRGKLANYEQGSHESDYDTLNHIANYFNVSFDYLIGHTENHNPPNDAFNPISEINKLLKKYDIDQSGFFDIDKRKAMGPEGIKELEDYFEFITSRAKEKINNKTNTPLMSLICGVFFKS